MYITPTLLNKRIKKWNKWKIIINKWIIIINQWFTIKRFIKTIINQFDII